MRAVETVRRTGETRPLQPVHQHRPSRSLTHRPGRKHAFSEESLPPSVTPVHPPARPPSHRPRPTSRVGVPSGQHQDKEAYLGVDPCLVAVARKASTTSAKRIDALTQGGLRTHRRAKTAPRKHENRSSREYTPTSRIDPDTSADRRAGFRQGKNAGGLGIQQSSGVMTAPLIDECGQEPWIRASGRGKMRFQANVPASWIVVVAAPRICPTSSSCKQRVNSGMVVSTPSTINSPKARASRPPTRFGSVAAMDDQLAIGCR